MTADRREGREHGEGSEEERVAPDASSPPPLRCVDLVKTFGDHKVLDGIDLTCSAGETNVIIGGSGAGKTTLLRTLIGLEKPTSGRVEVDGEDIAPMNEF